MGKLLARRYQFIKVLDTDELGRTYLVVDIHSPQHPKCVVKQIRLPPNSSPTRSSILSRLEKTSELLKKLGQHDQIPRLITTFAQTNQFYLVQEFIRGHPLTDELIPGDPLTENQVISLLNELLNLLVFVHQQGAVLGNLKPSTIIRRQGDDKLVLTTWGIIHQLSPQIAQSFHKLAPNPPNPTFVDHSSKPFPEPLHVNRDLSALGIIAIQAMTGLSVSELAELKQANQGQPETSAWQAYTQVSPELAAILEKMVHDNHQNRYHHAKTVLADLSRIPERNTVTQFSLPSLPDINPAIATVTYPSRQFKPWVIFTAIGLVGIMALVLAYTLRLPQRLMAQYVLHQGKIQAQEQQSEAAIDYYTQAITYQPQNATAYYYRGKIYANQGKTQSALADLTQAIQLNPQNADAYYQRGNLRLELGDRQGAKADYTQVLQRDPNFTPAWVNRGQVQADLGHEQAAIEDYTQAIQLKPNLITAYLKRCRSRSNLGNQKGAIDDCTTAINLRPNQALAYQNRGLARQRRGDSRGAITDYTVAIQLNPEAADAYYNRGVARQEIEDTLGAIADYTQAIERNPDYALAYYERGLAQAQLGNRLAAIDDLQQAAQLCRNLGKLDCYEAAQSQLSRVTPSPN
ncbi:tetratricopeptide repeat protein [Coleofasciculus sp. E2-BRE-01]|uniref:tetratricopeptide repeat protein n=1 Tax=Coleofasciculus sp. E2-BRE-01 TaxID=3069524 RepID=UPI0032FB80AE